MRCGGTATEHCCWLGPAGVCPHLEEHTVEGRRWVCGLLRELGSWGAVYADPRYVADVQPFWDTYVVPGLSCGDWPQKLPAEIAAGVNLCCWAD